MKADSIIIAKQKEESNKDLARKVIIETVKVEAKQIPTPIHKDKYVLVFFADHNYMVIHKVSQFSSAETVFLPTSLILLVEIKSMRKLVDKKMLYFTLDNKGVYNIYFRKLEKCELIEQIINKKLKIMDSFYDTAVDQDRTWAKYNTAAYFETLYNVDNRFADKYKSLLNDDVFEYFKEAINTPSHNVLNRKLWFGKFKKYERRFKLENLKELLKDIKGKNLVDREALGVMVTHKQFVDYSNEPFKNYMNLYFDILENEFLPKWMDANHLYVFKIDKLAKEEVFSKVNPFYEFISLV